MAKPIPNLPNEILHNILSLSSSKELRQAPLVSRRICAISTVYLFKYQCFNMNAQAEENLPNILAAKQVAENVQELDIIGPRRPWDFGYKLPQFVQDTLNGLSKLENLSTLTVRFEEDYVYRKLNYKKKRVAYRNDMLASILTSLIPRSTKNRLQHLCISNLQNLNAPSMTNSVGFIDLLRNLRTLRLEIQSNEIHPGHIEDHRIRSKESVIFFNILPDTWLRLACQNLKSLYLSADLPWGWYPKVDFRHTRFPHLQSLTLGKFTFSHNWQLEWLLSHAESLRSLRIITCSILAFADTTPQRLDSDGYLNPAETDSSAPLRTQVRFEGRLCDYFRAFASALPRLQLFRLSDIDLVDSEDDIVHAPADQVLVLPYRWKYKAYISNDYHSYFHYNIVNPNNKGARKQWEERLESQRNEDEQALFELLDIIEERNTARL